MFKRFGSAALALLLCVMANAAFAQAQNYPVRPIRLIVPYPPGGSTDPTGRALGQWLAEKFGQPVEIGRAHV